MNTPSFQYHAPSSVGDAVALLNQYGIGCECIEKAQDPSANVVFLDMRMPIKDGINAFKQLKELHQGMLIVILTTNSDEQDIFEAFKNSDSDSSFEDMTAEQLPGNHGNETSAGKTDSNDSGPVLMRFDNSSKSEIQDQDPFAVLTPRENQTLELIADGQGNKAIARNMGISDGTVKLHVRAILRKLEIHSRVEAAVMFLEYHLQPATHS